MCCLGERSLKFDTTTATFKREIRSFFKSSMKNVNSQVEVYPLKSITSPISSKNLATVQSLHLPKRNVKLKPICYTFEYDNRTDQGF